MGLIHSRAAKQRDREQARLAREERLTLRQARRTADPDPVLKYRPGAPWYRQPTVGALVRALRQPEGR